MYAISLLIKFAFFLYLIHVQYNDSEDALWLDEESTDMGYLELLNVRFVCQCYDHSLCYHNILGFCVCTWPNKLCVKFDKT